MTSGTKTLRIKSEHPAEKWLSSVDDWICVLLVWTLIIGMLSAMISVLVGSAD
jgi:hypothetical protein